MRWLASENGFVHVCGHRGHSIAAPENTLAALSAARELGGTTCEIDCVLSQDGEIVLMHDDTLDRTTNGRGLVGRTPLRAIRELDAGGWFDQRFAGEPVPILAEAVVHARQIGLGLVVEIKERRRADALVPRLRQVLDDTDGYGQVIVISFDHVQLRAVKEAVPGVRTEGITHARHADIVAIARAARLDSVSIEHEMFQPADAEALHEVGVAVRLHLERPAWFAHYRALGIDHGAEVGGWLRAGLVDSLSGDDVGFLAGLVRDNPIE